MLIDDDCDITVNKMKVSLRCPISLLRISEPAKGQNCRHIGVSKKFTHNSTHKFLRKRKLIYMYVLFFVSVLT